jgi:HPt (histidine-containing phosphotransfer) domain-containing protein
LLDQSVLSRLREALTNPDSNSIREPIERFLETAPQDLTLMGQAMRDPTTLAEHAAALKSKSAEAGAKRIAALCQKMEELGHNGNLESAPAVLQELRSAFSMTRTQLLPLVTHSSLESAS